jgi:hypothetical protein
VPLALALIIAVVQAMAGTNANPAKAKNTQKTNRFILRFLIFHFISHICIEKNEGKAWNAYPICSLTAHGILEEAIDKRNY